MAVNGGHAGTKKGPNWGHAILTDYSAIGSPIPVSFIHCCGDVSESKALLDPKPAQYQSPRPHLLGGIATPIAL